MDELIFIKINFCSLEDSIKKTKEGHKLGGNSDNIYIRRKDSIQNIFKNKQKCSYYSIIRGETTQLKFLQNILTETYEWQ